MKFYKKEFGESLVLTYVEDHLQRRIEEIFTSVGGLIEEGSTRQGLETVFEFIRWSNKRFDDQRPWVIVKENREEGKKVLEEFLYIICNLRMMIEPFLPFTAFHLGKQLGIHMQPAWKQVSQPLTLSIENTNPLFDRIDLESIEAERGKLLEKSNDTQKGE